MIDQIFITYYILVLLLTITLSILEHAYEHLYDWVYYTIGVVWICTPVIAIVHLIHYVWR